jgi:hypothetical protein
MKLAVLPKISGHPPPAASLLPRLRSWFARACAALIEQRRQEALRQLHRRYGDFGRANERLQ